MTPPSRDRDVTALLRAWGRGDRATLDELLPLVYGELRRAAVERERETGRRWLRRELEAGGGAG